MPVRARHVVAATVPLLLAGAAAWRHQPAPPPCAPDNAGLALAPGLCASALATDAGPVRHLVAAPNGDVYAAVEGGSGGVLVLRDADGDGTAEIREKFGEGGGTGIALGDGWLYFARADRVLRWKWTVGQLRPEGEAQVVVSGLPTGGHGAKTIALKGDQLFVNVGSRSNSCQQADRTERSMGVDPCPELPQRAGIWVFSASRTDQKPADGRRWATGLRNATAIAVHPGTGMLWAGTHGRDQLAAHWGFSNEYSAENPGEEVGPVPEGADYGWPYCYYDTGKRQKILAPEYGGNGETVGRCAQAASPALAFPGHWAPMAIAFPRSAALGAEFAEGAFVAFHGSWNRAPLPQQGYRVVFAPFRDGQATGTYTTVLSGAAGETSVRPSGLAIGPDGSLYVAADRNGTIWRVRRAG